MTCRSIIISGRQNNVVLFAAVTSAPILKEGCWIPLRHHPCCVLPHLLITHRSECRLSGWLPLVVGHKEL